MRMYKCPKCNAPPHKHGKGGSEWCMNGPEDCEGLICECGDEYGTDADDHGESESNICENANCYHCGWGGRLPLISDTKRWPPWAKTALKEGWRPPSGWEPKRGRG